MAIGRLKRESNPLPGYEAGFLPQHERADGEFQTTGENHPLPTGNYVQNDSGVWVPVSKQNPMPVQLTGRNVLLSFLTGVNVSAGASFVAIGLTPAENISGIYVLVRADASHKYRISLDYHREKTSEYFSSYTGGVDILESAERIYGVSKIIKPIGYKFAILIRNESEEDHIYDVEVRSE